MAAPVAMAALVMMAGEAGEPQQQIERPTLIKPAKLVPAGGQEHDGEDGDEEDNIADPPAVEKSEQGGEEGDKPSPGEKAKKE